MFGNRLIKSNNAGAACTTDTVQILGGTSCIAYYKMSDATDETGSYDGTPTNVNFNVAGKFGNAGEFNGSTSKVELPISVVAGNVLTVSLWFNSTSNNSPTTLFSARGSASSDVKFIISLNRDAAGDGKIGIDTGTSTGFVTLGTYAGNYNDGNWHHVVATINYTTKDYKVYIDGISRISGNNSSIYTGWNVTKAQIGVNNLIQYLNGKIDQVRIFNRAITANEVTTLYDEVQCIPTIVPSEHFNTVIYSGNNTAKTVSVGFAPDLVWIKNRNNSTNSTHDHSLFDSVRTTGYRVRSNSTGAENDYSSHMSGFTSGGFNLTTSGALNDGSGSGTYVAWNWKAAGPDVLNEEGTINSQVSANVDAGFSIVSYSGGNSSGTTVGHGLGKSLDMLIVKNRSDGTDNWITWHKDVERNSTSTDTFTLKGGNALALNLTNSTFSYSYDGQMGSIGGENLIAYCFAEVDGYSKIGSYTGNGSTSGPTITTGFRPAFVLIKTATGYTTNWYMFDNKRDATNPRDNVLLPNLSNAEIVDSAAKVDFNSTSFQLKSGDIGLNGGSGTYIFMAFAEEVFNPNGVTRNDTDPFGDGSELALYKFEDNANDAEGSYDATFTSPSYATGYIDKAAVFNGSSSQITFPYLSGITPTSDISASLWINGNAQGNADNVILSLWDNSNLELRVNNVSPSVNEIIFVYRTSSYGSIDSTFTMDIGSWTHLAFTYSYGIGFTVYKNGVSSGLLPFTGTIGTLGGTNKIGAFGLNNSQYFNGSIDQVRIFDRALDAGEVEQLYNE